MSGIKNTGTGLRHFINAAGYTWNGLKEACREAAFRQELFLGLLSVPLAWYLFTPLQAAVLTAAWLGVLIVELLNTAIEAVVDLASPSYHELAKRAKDLASAAVACAIAAYVLLWAAALSRLA